MATGQRAEPQADKIMDPVCGLRVVPETAAASRAYAGVTYFFHSLACRDEFDAHPAQFVAASRQDPADGDGPPPPR